MRIKTQFIITMLLFGIILVVLGTSAIITNRQTEKASEQEKIASSIAQGASELSYLANDYLIYRESQQLERWQSRFASFSNQVTSLNVDKPEQQVLVRNIQANQKRLKQVFDSVASAPGSPSKNQGAVFDSTFRQVSWSRMAVQSQALVSDASRLSKLLDQQQDQLGETRTMLMYFMVGLLGLFLLASYMLTYRRILKSIVALQARAAVIGSGNLNFTIEEKRNDEIGDLSRAFNQMTTNLKAVTASKADMEREVTQRKQAEEDLRRQREWLSVTLSSIGDAVIASDTESRITFLNPVAMTLTGWQLETLGQPIQDVFRIVNEKNHAPAEDLVARVLREKHAVALANDTALVTKDGREVPIEDSAAPILDAAGNVTGVVLVFHDVTRKRRAQAALLEAHERATWLARFPDENPNPVLRASADGSVLYCNRASVEMHGWACKVGQLLPDPLSLLVRQAMAEGKEAQQDVEVGGRFYFVAVTPFPGEGYANVYGRDITEHKQAEVALRESEKRYRSYIEVTEQLGWSTNADGEVVEDIPSWRKFTGQSEEEVKGWGWSKALHPDDLEHTARVWRNAVATKNNYEVEYRIRRYDGVYRYFLARGVPVFKDDGKILQWVGTCIDITERKRAEVALRESEQRLNRAQEIAHLGSWELDLVNSRLTWSDEVYRIFGLQPQEFRATYEAFLEAVHPDDRAAVDASYSGSVREGRDAYEIEHRVVRKSTGEIRTVQERCEHIRDASGRIIRSIGMVHDITQRKRAEEALRQRTLELEQMTDTLEQRVRERTAELAKANEALRYLSSKLLSAQEEERKRIAGEIHDTLGACLAAIKFKVEDVLQQIEKTAKAPAQSLSTIVPVIQDAVEECRRIQMDLRPSILDDLGLLPTLSWFCRRFQTIYSRIRIEQEINIGEGEIPNALKTVIYRVTQEGMNNIAKHSQADVVRLSLRNIDARLELVLEDNGQGFNLEKVLSPPGTRRGLGLSSMRERTELSGGSLNIESTVGKGTMIRASWPI